MVTFLEENIASPKKDDSKTVYNTFYGVWVIGNLSFNLFDYKIQQNNQNVYLES